MVKLTAISLIALWCLTACDVDWFGFDSKRLGGGYRLALYDGPDQCVLMAPGAEHGPLVAEIGWRKPLILLRRKGVDMWDVIDTTSDQTSQLSDEERKVDGRVRDIQCNPAPIAWKKLKRRKDLW